MARTQTAERSDQGTSVRPVPTRLKITTVKGEQQSQGDLGQFLLANVQGVEGVSIPFSYQVRMFRAPELDDIDPRDMINTPVTFGIRSGPVDYSYRCGVFQTFEKDQTNERTFSQGLQKDYRVFRGIIVPAFKLLDYEVTFRIFEDMTVLEIIHEVMNFNERQGGFKFIGGNYLSTDLLKGEQFPKIPYCVQFNESSFAFLTRLMAEFGIWYIFNHPQQSSPAATETMAIGKSHGKFDDCAIKEMDVVWNQPDMQEISGFGRNFLPVPRAVKISNFNILKPESIPRGEKRILVDYDMIEQGDSTMFRSEVFPSVFDDPVSSNDNMSSQAETFMQQDEAGVFVVQGQSKNPTFMGGRLFQVREDKTKQSHEFSNVGIPSGEKYLITLCTVTAYENTYGHDAGRDIANWLDSPLRYLYNLVTGDNADNQGYLDATSAIANGALGNYIQNLYSVGPTTANVTLHNKTYANAVHGYSDVPFLGAAGFGGLATILSGLLGVWAATGVKDIFRDHKDDYSNSFQAVPFDGQTYTRVPLPVAAKPRASGPHLAVVIGPKGKEVDGTVYADAIGRVRVRFPWQIKVQPPAGQPESQATDPLDSDKRTAWVPVCEGWAGRHFGSQFWPRIGQQVLVDFIDGDPDRPIITGRVYSADKGPTNVPFPHPDIEKKDVVIRKSTDGSNSSATELPATAETALRYSGLKTWSVPFDDPNGKPDKTRYHLLRFDDTTDKEQYLIRSQHRLDITAFETRYERIHLDRHLIVGGKKKDSSEVVGDYITKIYRHYYLHVGDPADSNSGNRNTLIEKNDELKVMKDYNFIAGSYNAATGNYYLHVGGGPQSGGNRKTIIDQNDDVKVGQNFGHTIGQNWQTKTGMAASLNAGMSIVINAGMQISLKVGGNFINIDPTGVQIVGTMVMINSGGAAGSPSDPSPPSPADPSIEKPKDPTAADPGDKLTPPE